jgi:hypothetical protein
MAGDTDLICSYRPITAFLLAAASGSKVPMATSHDVSGRKFSDQRLHTNAYDIKNNFTKG